MPTKVRFGAGQLSNLHTGKMPGRKALIVTPNGSSMKKYGSLDRLLTEIDQLDTPCTLFPEVRANSTHKNVSAGATLDESSDSDFVIAMSRGSVMNCAKCIALMMTNLDDILDYFPNAGGGKQNPATLRHRQSVLPLPPVRAAKWTVPP